MGLYLRDQKPGREEVALPLECQLKQKKKRAVERAIEEGNVQFSSQIDCFYNFPNPQLGNSIELHSHRACHTIVNGVRVTARQKVQPATSAAIAYSPIPKIYLSQEEKEKQKAYISQIVLPV